MKVYLSRYGWYSGYQYYIGNSIDDMINQYGIANLYELDLKKGELIYIKSVYRSFYDIEKGDRTSFRKYGDDTINCFVYIVKEGDDFDNYDYDTMKKKSEQLFARLKKVGNKAELIKKTKEKIRGLQKQLEELEKE